MISFVVVLTLANLHAMLGLEVLPEVLEEMRAVVKRLSDEHQVYTDHEIVTVLHEKEPNSFHQISRRDLRTVTDDDTTQRLRLGRASGSNLHFRLKKRSLFSRDTQFIDHIHGQHRVKRASPPQDCYATGDVKADGMSDGFVSVATCDGLHGTAVINGTEYYIYPVSHADWEHKVHLLSRRLSDDVMKDIPDTQAIEYVKDPEDNVISKKKRSRASKAKWLKSAIYKTATSFVIEMAIFLDEGFWKKIQKRAPGREYERVFTTMSAVNALYSNKDKVGYDARIKIKLLETWVVNPEGYKFQNNLLRNLRSFCTYTTGIYKYDLHFLFTGLTKFSVAAGRAYFGNICNGNRCGDSYTLDYQLIAHEIGHTLGFRHHGKARCPKSIKTKGGGFMGGSNAYDFSPCNKWELRNFLWSGSGRCLFKETGVEKTSERFVNLPRLLGGQQRNPDELCRYNFGDGYENFRPYDVRGVAECSLRMCINRNETSGKYLFIKRSGVKVGYTCGDDMFCGKHSNCRSWDKPAMGWSPKLLRETKRENHWSDWSDEWSSCSHPCGKGVQIKRRRCILSPGPFLSPYCRGAAVDSRLCNEDPCRIKKSSAAHKKKPAAEALCKRFIKNNLLRSIWVIPMDIYLGSRVSKYFPKQSCLFACKRGSGTLNKIDGMYPDGTPCKDSNKNDHLRHKFNIDLRCVDGACTEFSDCPNNEVKDACGICGGDPVRCVERTIDQSKDVPKGDRQVLAKVPAGSRLIDVSMTWYLNPNIRLELWNARDEKIIGSGGRYGRSRYRSVSFANTKWTYSQASYLRAEGPTDQDLVIKALRQSNPIKTIYVSYLLPDKAPAQM